MAKKWSIFLLIATMISVLSGCGNSSAPKREQHTSRSEKVFKSKPEDTSKEKRIIKLYAQRGIKVDISPFKAGYQVIPRDGSLLGNLRNNDKDGYIQNQLVPISKIISQESNAKIYLKANNPNNVLLAVCNNGEIEYTLLR